MLTAFRTLFGRERDDKKLIKRYTKDLTSLTGKIHEFENRLKGNEENLKTYQAFISYYFSGALAITAALIYYRYSLKFALLSIFVGFQLILVTRILLNKWFEFLSRRYGNNLNKLKSLHQEKMEELKDKTNFYYTSSLIQRFSSGDTGSDDLMLLMDDEVKSKREQLEKLKDELEALRSKEDTEKQDDAEARDKWFDKVVGLLSGGDESSTLQKSLTLIVCPQCKQSHGCYGVRGVPYQYICPNCKFEIKSNKTADVSEGQNVDDSAPEK